LPILNEKVPLKLHSAANLPDSAAEYSDSTPHDATYSHERKRKNQSARKKRVDKSSRPEEESSFGLEIFDDPSLTEPNYQPPHGDIKFCSRSEAICAELLKRFVPHFDLREGVTFQVAIGRDSQGNTLAVDFLVDGVLFEYHPVRLFKSRRRCGDFNSKHEYRAYADVCHSLRGDQREFFQAAMKSRLAKNYYAKRRALLDEHPMYRRMELIVATSPEEFYALVLKRFGRNVPRSVERFMAIFEELRESLP
jgi:hypothetical protein